MNPINGYSVDLLEKTIDVVQGCLEQKQAWIDIDWLEAAEDADKELWMKAEIVLRELQCLKEVRPSGLPDIMHPIGECDHCDTLRTCAEWNAPLPPGLKR